MPSGLCNDEINERIMDGISQFIKISNYATVPDTYIPYLKFTVSVKPSNLWYLIDWLVHFLLSNPPRI
jgi:hypothetical protein